MADRYVPNGKPCTPREREILTILMEECGEVITAASKLIRFGVENRPHDGLDNRTVLSREVGDLLCMLGMADSVKLTDGAVVEAYARRKAERLAHYMQTEADGAPFQPDGVKPGK